MYVMGREQRKFHGETIHLRATTIHDNIFGHINSTDMFFWIGLIEGYTQQKQSVSGEISTDVVVKCLIFKQIGLLGIGKRAQKFLQANENRYIGIFVSYLK